ncbi:MAG: hypothetical protein M3384_04865 [Acidobacteriota bacterium]|nr:hypothetical protein [Acidobacteriota bacterium]
MKKHAFGFALFSFIVAVAVVVSNLLAFEPANVHLTDSYEEPQPRYFCKKKQTRRNYDFQNAKIEQAVLDLETKQLRVSFSLPPQSGVAERGEEKSYTLALHYFAKNGSETRFLKTQNNYLNSAFDTEKEWLLTSSEWLDTLESYDNLYIVPEIRENASVNSLSVKGGNRTNPKKQPRFDYSTAAPVLLSGDRDF